MDERLRRLERNFHESPNLEALILLISAYARAGITENDYPHLVDLLRSVDPFGQYNWPWIISDTWFICNECHDITNEQYTHGYETCIKCEGPMNARHTTYRDYGEALHRDILNLVVRIRPITRVFEILERGATYDLSDLLRVIRRELIREQVHQIDDSILEEHFDSLDDAYEALSDSDDAEGFLSQIGLLDYPEFLVLDPQGDTDLRCVVITVVHSEENREARRYNVCLDAEPSTGIFWEQYWDNDRGFWLRNRQSYEDTIRDRRGSSTFIPYKEYCGVHEQNLEDCDPCPVCQDKRGHPCECEQCEDCGLYWNHWNWELVPEELRCQCD